MKPKSHWRLMAAVGLALFLLGGSLRAATTLGLTAPAYKVSPGVVFEVELWVESTMQISVGQYEVPITYDPDVFEVLEVISGTAAEFGLEKPALVINRMSQNFTVYDSMWGTGIKCTYYTGRWSLAKIKMRAKKTAPLGVDSYMDIPPILGRSYYLYDCNEQTGIVVDGRFPVYVYTADFEEKTYDLEQYLDVDADYKIGEGDVDFFSEIINKYRYNVGNAYQVKLGGIQMDFRGNARPDVYDLGSAEAVARPTRFVRSGVDGICSSTASSSDVQEIIVGQGYPYAIAILPGPNNVLNGAPAGDDTIYGMVITTGANGISETAKSGDDVQAIGVGKGEANQICVSPGADGKLSTTLIGDDGNLDRDKEISEILTYDYITPGRPREIEIVYPPLNAGGGNEIYLPKARTTPLLVRVVDEFGNPKPGISPTFEVVSGPAAFIYGREGSNPVMKGQPADQFLTLGNAPEGAVGGLLDAPEYSESIVRITVAANPDKGIDREIMQEVRVTCVPQNPPATLELKIDPEFEVGMNLPGIITALDEKSEPVFGYARRIKLVTSRNLANGCLGVWDEDCGAPILADDFELGLKGWEVSNGAVIKAVAIAGAWVGDVVVRAVATVPSIVTMTTTINPAGFTTKKMKMSFQWRYWNDNKYLGKLVVQYRDGTTGSWVNLREIYGQGQLRIGENNFVWEEIDLSNVKLDRFGSFSLRLLFNLSPNGAPPYGVFYVDNFSIAGFQSILDEKFDTEEVGRFPLNMDYSNYINAGAYGRSYKTAPVYDDVAVIPYGQGEPNQEAIWPGLNKVLDTVPAGDDMIAVINGNTVITTGANGICNTTVTGDDFQLLRSGYGKPFARMILPGANQVLDTDTVNIRNEIVNPIGPDPWIKVNSTGGAEGSVNSVSLGREFAGTISDYAFEKRLDLAGYKHVYLSFYTKTLNMDLEVNPKPQFICEISDDQAHTWIPVWDFEGVDHAWTYHEIPLHSDPRFNLVNGLIIRWRAATSMNYKAQNAFVDQIRVFGSTGEADVFTAKTYDLGNGTYNSAISTFAPGFFRVAAVYVPESINYTVTPYDLPIVSDAFTVEATAFQVDPRTVKIMPANFILKACERINYQVIGKAAGYTHYWDLTKLYRLQVHGPGRMVAPGIFEAECFVGATQTEKPQFFIRAIPLVSTLYDPEGTGTAVQTGLISGKIFLPTLQGAATASVTVVIPSSGSIYGVANSLGNYIFGAVPTGINYTVKSLKTGYSLNYKAAVGVTAGTNTTINVILKNGADCDGDGTLDAADIDDDADGITDTMETVKGIKKCNLDSDNDTYGDGADLFPADGTEWLDSDGDGIGDNDEIDDDADGLSDTEEADLGVDGFITNGQDPDTDHDGITDYQEYVRGTDPTVANPGEPDTDLDGVFNSQEQGGGTCGVSWNKINTKSNSNNTDTDGDAVNDYTEVYFYNTNPSCHDTDLDGLHDNLEGSSAVVKPCPYANIPDSDGDGLCDGNTTVMDGSTVVCADGEDLNVNKVVDAGETDPCNPDSDGDMMPDGWEVQYGLNPLVNDAASDPDGDTLNNLTEFINSANPNSSDTDGDGIRDDVEVANGLNPAVPNWGTIRVSSDPTGAKVYLDGTQVYRGRYVGLSGTVGVPLSVGTLKNEKHTITIVGANYFVNQTIVDVTLGQTFTVNQTLAYRKLEVFTTSAPVMAGGHTVQPASGYAAPHVVDFDKNGTMDLFVGAYDGSLVYYSNASSNSLSLAAGVAVQAAGVALDAGTMARPFVVDWNNDNKLDLIIGNSAGQVLYYAGNGATNFSAGVQIQAGGVPLVVGTYSAPVVVDWDGDNKKDLVIGSSDGYLYLYLNSGTDAAPSFSSGASITDAGGGAIDAGSYSTPIVYDVLRHGYMALGFGNNLGQIGGCGYDPADSGYHCSNPFLSTTSSDVTSYIDIGSYAAASFADVNADRQLDVFLGNSAGLVVYYQSSHLTGDLDRSTKVDAGDWILVKQSMGLCKGNGGYNPGADLNGDNCVTAADLTVLVGNFGKTY